MLRVRESLPPGLLEARLPDLAELLGGPTLLHLPGLREPPVFLSIVLHGNEPAGLEALQTVLGWHAGRSLPRALSVFIGNVEAARLGLRRLTGQPDYNRVWPGSVAPDSPERRMAAEVVARMRRRGVFASLDIHNNTGVNPWYGCVNQLEGHYLHLASLFSRTIVYFTRPLGVQSMAFAEICPAVTVECGKAGSREGMERAAELIDATLHLSHIPEAVSPRDVDVYHTVAAVRVPDGCTFGFGDTPAQIRLFEDLERLNFRELPAGTAIARVDPGSPAFLSVEDNAGHEAADDYLERVGEEIRLRQAAVPSMLTRDERVIRQDVLCYLMERLEVPVPGTRHAG